MNILCMFVCWASVFAEWTVTFFSQCGWRGDSVATWQTSVRSEGVMSWISLW